MLRSIVVLVMLGWLAGPAGADEVKGDRKTAERFHFAAERAYKAQNFAAAAQNFDEAYKALPLPEIAFSTAQAYRRLYRVEPKLEYAKRSVELYRVYLDQVKTGGRIGNAADYIGEMQREVDKLTVVGTKTAADSGAELTRLGVSPLLTSEQRADSGLREIADLPETDDVKITTMIDGKAVPPFQMVEVEPGPHTIRVEAEGYLVAESTERVVKGTSSVAEIVLKPKPARVTIKTEQGARIRVDGRPVGTVPGTVLELPAGKHIITIMRDGREVVSRDIDVSRGQELLLEQPLEKTARRRAVPFVATGAAVFAGLTIAGAVYAVIQDNRADDQLATIQVGDQRPEAATRYDDLIARRNDVRTGVLITGSAALAFGAAAAALYWLDRPSQESMRITPAITGGGAGVSIGGRF